MIYEYQCGKCGNKQTAFRRVADRHQVPACDGCETDSEVSLIISPVRGRVCSFDYQCPVTGQQVTSKRQRRNIMAEHNLRDANGLEVPKPGTSKPIDDTPQEVKDAMKSYNFEQGTQNGG